MPSFTDQKGRTWELELDILTTRRVDKSDFTEYYPEPFSLSQLDGPVMQKLLMNGSFLFAVIWAIIQPQVEEKFKQGTFPYDPKIQPEEAELEFVSSIKAKAKADGFQAFLEAIGDFFPELKTASSMLNQAQPILREKLDKGVEKMLPMLEDMMDQEMDKMTDQFRKTLDEKRGGILFP